MMCCACGFPRMSRNFKMPKAFPGRMSGIGYPQIASVEIFPYCNTFALHENCFNSFNTNFATFFADPPPPFNATSNPRVPTAPASTNACHPCSSFAHPMVNCFPKNGPKSPKNKRCSTFLSCFTQFLIFCLSLMTFLLILMQQVFPNSYPNQNMVTQIWKSKNDQTGWMPSHFQTWSSEKETENHNNHSVVIEGIPILCKNSNM